MKVTIQNKKGLSKDLKIFVEKKIIDNHLNEKYSEVSKTVQLKGFRPGKVPKEVLKRQFGKAIFGEVLDKILKETSAKALSENKIKPAGQPKIDLKTFGENKDLEYIISVTELPKIDLKPIETIKVDEYEVKIDKKEIDKRIEDIAKNQKNFKENENAIAKNGDLVSFDYKAKVDGEDFKGNEGKNTQLEIGKDLFIKGFDKQLIGVKKNDEKKILIKLPENFPDKDVANKNAEFICKILFVKNPEKVSINDDFAKSLGAKDLNDLKVLLEKQINDEYKNSLNMLSKKQILDQIEKYKVRILPASPTFLNLMYLNKCFDKYDFSSVILITYGTEPMSEILLNKLRDILPKTKFLQTFGTSETGIIKTISKSSSSLLIKFDDPNQEYKIVNDELWLRSKTQVLGYLNHSNKNFTNDGWFKTGDLVEVYDEKFLKIKGRKKEVINIGGEKVLPIEVESVINKLDYINDCTIYSENHSIMGQIMIARIVIDSDKDFKEIKKHVRKHCKKYLDSFKVPSKFIIKKEIEFSNRFKKKRLYNDK